MELTPTNNPQSTDTSTFNRVLKNLIYRILQLLLNVICLLLFIFKCTLNHDDDEN